MAAAPADNQNTNPIIIEPEPEAASSGPTPSRLLAPSLNSSNSSSSTSSSSSSSTSRPESRASTNATTTTTPSESPSPAVASRDIEPYELSNMRSHLTTAPDMTEPQSPTSQLSPNERRRDTRTSSTIGPEGSSSHGSNGLAWPPVLPRRRWFEHSLGIFGLVASLVGLLFIGVRTYKLAVISTENSTLDGCTGLIQAGFVTLENSTQLCKTAMKNGPLSSPYHLGKRALRSGLALVSQFANSPNRKLSAPAIIISTTLALGGLILIIARRNARLTDVFTSPAYSDIHITHHQDSGPKTITGQGVLEKHNSGEHDLGGIHKRIRASQDQDVLMKDTAPLQSTDSSASTLVNECSEPQVSLQDRTSGEKHEGLIELQMNGHTKAFYKFETGELLHLKHWKDKYKDASHSVSHKENPLSVE